MKISELEALRAKSGMAALKKAALKELKMLEGMSWHYVILAVNIDSTYGGIYPEGIIKARDAHFSKIEAQKLEVLKYVVQK